MDKKITIPAGIALMVVLAVAGMLAIFSYNAATPVQADIEAGSVEYTGPTLPGATGEVTIGFKIDEDIEAADEIVITFPTGFTVDPTAGNLGNVTVNMTSSTVTVSNGAVTVSGVAVGIAAQATTADVSIGIPTGIDAPETVGPYDITVEVEDVATTGTVTVMIVGRGQPVQGPVAGFVGDYTITFATEEDLESGQTIKVDFPTAIPLSEKPTVTLNETVVVGGNIGLSNQTVTINIASGTEFTVPAGTTVDITLVFTGTSDNKAPADVGSYIFRVEVTGFPFEVLTYSAAPHDYEVDFDTVPDKPNKSDEVVVKFYAPAGGFRRAPTSPSYWTKTSRCPRMKRSALRTC